MFFDILKKLENLVCPSPLCVSTSGQRQIGPPIWNPKYATADIPTLQGRIRTRNLSHHKRVPIPLDHSDGPLLYNNNIKRTIMTAAHSELVQRYDQDSTEETDVLMMQWSIKILWNL